MAAVELGSTYLLNDPTLRAYYKLENADDTTSNNYDLTNNGTTTFAAAKFNDGADFGTTVNGVKSLSIASDIGITTGTMSVSLWVKLRTEITASAGYYYFVDKASAAHVEYIIRYNYNNGTPRLEFVRNRMGTAEDMVTYDITLGTAAFYHLTMTYDGTSIRGYVNGALVGSPVTSSGAGASGGTDKMYIGAKIVGASTTQTDLYTSNGSFSVPIGVTSIIVKAWGAGGGGANGGGNPDSGDTSTGGGGGGGFSQSTLAVSAGTNYAIAVGAAGAIGSAGGDSTFGTTLVVAKGGTGGSGSAAGTGGQASAGTGDTKYSGGNGGFGDQGGGGGSAGPNGNGSNGVNAGGAADNGGVSGGADNGGTGGSDPVRGGGGGGGSANNAVGGAAGTPGGGGGAGEDNGAAGARGQVSVTYDLPTYESLAYIDDVSFFNTDLSASTIAGLYAGTLAGVGAKGLDKLSTTAAYNNVFLKFFNIGKKFRMETIRVPLTNDVDAGTSILVNCIIDDGSDIIPLKTINNTNFPGQRYVVLHPPENVHVRGRNNMILEFIFTGTTEIGISFPVDIDLDVNDFEK